MYFSTYKTRKYQDGSVAVRLRQRSIQKDLTHFFFIFYYELLFNIQMFEFDQTKDFSDVLAYRQNITITILIYGTNFSLL